MNFYRYGDKYYQYRNTGLQNQSVLYTLENLEGDSKIFLDPNQFSTDGTVALSGTAFSQNGKILAYGLSESGSDWLQIKFKNTETCKSVCIFFCINCILINSTYS